MNKIILVALLLVAVFAYDIEESGKVRDFFKKVGQKVAPHVKDIAREVAPVLKEAVTNKIKNEINKRIKLDEVEESTTLPYKPYWNVSRPYRPYEPIRPGYPHYPVNPWNRTGRPVYPFNRTIRYPYRAVHFDEVEESQYAPIFNQTWFNMTRNNTRPQVYPGMPYRPNYTRPYRPVYPGYPVRPNYTRPGYPTRPTYPQYPQYPQYPTNPTYPQYPQYPTYPTYPTRPTYPQNPNYPGYPYPTAPYPAYPGVNFVEEVEESQRTKPYNPWRRNHTGLRNQTRRDREYPRDKYSEGWRRWIPDYFKPSRNNTRKNNTKPYKPKNPKNPRQPKWDINKPTRKNRTDNKTKLW